MRGLQIQPCITSPTSKACQGFKSDQNLTMQHLHEEQSQLKISSEAIFDSCSNFNQFFFTIPAFIFDKDLRSDYSYLINQYIGPSKATA